MQSNIPAKVALLAAILMGLILALDLAIPLGVAGGVPYVALMFLGSWLPKRRHVITLAVLTSLLTVIGYYYSPSGGIAWMVVSNRGLALFAIWVCALMAIKRMNAEASLGESEEKYRSIFESAPIGLSRIRLSDGTILDCNDYLARAFGFGDREEAMAAGVVPVDRYVDPAAREKMIAEVSQVFTVMLHDVSARQQAEAEMRTARERAEYADRAKSEFLVNMSHELRTPLNAILGFAQMIGGQVLGKDASDQYTGYAHDIRDSGEHLLAIVNDILDLSKVEAGKAELEEQDLDIGELVAATMRLVRDRASEWGLDLQIEVSSGKGKLRADARMLKQMLLNLLSNAIKFTPAGGRVLLRAGPDEDGSYRFVVIDTGVGIAPEDIPKALSQFGQVGDPKVQPGEGTGLGLPLVAALAELHGGELELESDVGVGTRATIRLPRERSIGAE